MRHRFSAPIPAVLCQLKRGRARLSEVLCGGRGELCSMEMGLTPEPHLPCFLAATST